MTDEVMQSNSEELAAAVVGERIMLASAGPSGMRITLASGRVVELHNSYDCCAYTELTNFFLKPSAIDHVITGVRVEDGYQTWHVYADMIDVLDLEVAWSEGSGYYGYGFDIDVKEISND